jgi:hypothetical protein
MWNVCAAYRPALMIAVGALWLLAACNSNESGPAELLPEPPPTENSAPIEDGSRSEVLTLNCSGESYRSGNLETYSDTQVSFPSMQESAVTYFLTNQEDGLSQILSLEPEAATYLLQENNSDSQPSFTLVALRLTPFAGTLLVSLRQEERSGWADCSPQSEAPPLESTLPQAVSQSPTADPSLNLSPAQSLLCRGHLRQGGVVQDHFLFSVSTSPDGGTEAMGEQYQITHRRRQGLIYFQVHSSRAQQDVAHLIIDSQVQELEAQFQLEDRVLHLQCRGEVL